MSDYDDFDDELDTDDEEDELAAEGDPETPLSVVYDYGHGGECDVYVKLENGDTYCMKVERWNWHEQPLVRGANGSLKSVNAAAAEIEYRIKHLTPLSQARHRQLAERLTAMIAELDALAPELAHAAGGRDASNLCDSAIDALTELEIALSDLHVRDYSTTDHPYSLSGVVTLECRCGLPGCLEPIPDEPEEKPS